MHHSASKFQDKPHFLCISMFPHPAVFKHIYQKINKTAILNAHNVSKFILFHK